MMRKYLNRLITVLPLSVIFLGYILNIVAIVDNRLRPSYESSLGTAYAFAFGLIIVVLGLVLAILTYNSRPAFQRHAIASIVAFCVYFLFGLIPSVTH